MRQASGLWLSLIHIYKVLKTEDSASVALKYNDIIAMKRAERSALVKGMDVIYIYHDTIDLSLIHILFAVFIERCGLMVKNNCYQAMITQHAWRCV